MQNESELLEDMLSSTENYRKAADKWCIKFCDHFSSGEDNFGL